tara:strand:+ start:49 stop:180 length:132 start_codon:yes stop_codon:yes gene_type:complete
MKNFKDMIYKNLFDLKNKGKKEPKKEVVKDTSEADKKEASKED